MPPNDEYDLPADPARTIARPTPSAGSLDSTPETFPSDAESLLRHLNIGAKRAGSPSPPAATGAGHFPHIPGYEIECELGRGGMGVVYKARHVALRHTVAIKMILASAHAAPGEVARFVAEAEAVAAIKHPNVVQVFDLGETDGRRPYFVMEYVDGGSLAASLNESDPLAPRAAAELIEAVARGVHAANEVGTVHRDLKPGNILLSIADCGSRNADSKTKEEAAVGSPPSASKSAIRDPRSAVPKVSDFGLAKRLSSDMTRTQAVMGTPAYMAPEQAGGKAKFVGPQADVYALGVILYQCLTGAVPFDDPDPWSLIRRVLDEAPERPRVRAPHVPRDVELICLKCLEKEPHHRYPTAAALADDLRRFLDGEAVSVRPIGAPTRFVRWARKRPAIATLWAVGVLLLIAVPAVVVGVRGKFQRDAEVTAEAQRAEKEARRAEDEAKRARVTAERLADAQNLFALQNKLRNRASTRALGWAVANLGELPQAVSLARGDPAVLEDLRSAAAVALLADDLAPAEPVARGLSAAAIATGPKSGLVAVGEHKGWIECDVHLVDPVSGRTVRQLTYKTVSVKGPNGVLDVVQDGTRALAFSPDGSRLFVGTRSSRVLRFDLTAEPNVPAAVWNVSSNAVGQLAVSPDGKTVYAVCRSDEPVFVFEADTGKPLKPLAAPGARAYGVAVLPSGGVITVGGGASHQWNANGTLARTVPSSDPGRIALGPGSMLLVGVTNRLEVYDRHSLARTDAFTDPNTRGAAHEESVREIAVHPSGAYAATAAGDKERAVKVWEVASGRLIAVVRAPGTGPLALAWSNDGNYLLATANKRVERWRFAPTGAQRFACHGPYFTEAATLFADGRVASLSELVAYRRELLVGAPGAPASAFEATEGGGGGRPGLSADPSGTLAITVTANGLCVWKPGPPFPPQEFVKHALRCARYSRDGSTIWAVFDAKEVRALDAKTRAVRGTWKNSIGDVLTGLGALEVFDVGLDRAAVATRDGSVYLLDANCESSATFRVPDDPVTALALAPDDSLVAAGTQSGKLRLIRTADETELPAVSAHAAGVSAVAVGRDGALLATGGRDRSVRLWKRSGDGYEPLFTVSDLPGPVRELRFDPTDGRLLVLLAHEHAVRVWDVDRLNAQLANLKLGW